MHLLQEATDCRIRSEQNALTEFQNKVKEARKALEQVSKETSNHLETKRKIIDDLTTHLQNVHKRASDQLEIVQKAVEKEPVRSAVNAKSMTLRRSVTSAEPSNTATSDPEVELSRWVSKARDCADWLVQALEQHEIGQRRASELNLLNRALALWLAALLLLSVEIFSLSNLIFGYIWLFVANCLVSTILLVGSSLLWDTPSAEPSKHFAVGYLILFLALSPLAPLFALIYILVSYPEGKHAINKRYPNTVSKKKLARDIKSHIGDLLEAQSKAIFWHDTLIKQAEELHKRNVQEVELELQRIQTESQQRCHMIWDPALKSDTQYANAMLAAKHIYEKIWDQLLHETQEIVKLSSWMGLPLDDPTWKFWTAPKDQITFPFVRIGQLSVRTRWNELIMPALLPLIGGRNIVIKTSGAEKNAAVLVVRSMILRILACIPPGKVRFVFFDPIGLGQSVDAFLELSDYDETLIGGKVWTTARHIEDQLNKISEHIEFVIQKFLRNKYPTIEKYNEEAGEVAEPYAVLVVVNFPTAFTEAAVHKLVSIASNGPRCGVFTLMTMDIEQRLPHGFDTGVSAVSTISQYSPQTKEGFNLDDLERTASNIVWTSKQRLWIDDRFKDCVLEIDSALPKDLLDRITKSVGVKAKDARRVEVPFDRIIPARGEWWRGSSLGGLKVPVGLAGARKVQYLELGQGTVHNALIVGRVGSGKSTLMHILLNALCMTYSPDEVVLYLVDFKKGVEFKDYAVYDLPHARVIAIESEREFGLSVLQGLNAELGRRGDLFRQFNVNHIGEYRKQSCEMLPRIVLVIDEFHQLFVEDDSISSKSSGILDQIVRQGRAFGIHVVLGSQSLSGTHLLRSTLDQMNIRIALQCGDAESRLILADDNPAARQLRRPGEAIYNSANGLEEANNLFQVAWLSDDNRKSYLGQIGQMATQHKYVPAQPKIIFEGNAPANVTRNRYLRNLLENPESLPKSESKKAIAWLGEPIAIKDPLAIHFRPQSGNNLLVVGSDDELTAGMLITALMGLITGAHQKASDFYIANYGPTDTNYAGLLNLIAEQLPNLVHIVSRRGLPDIITTITREINQRIDSQSGQGIRDDKSIYLLILGLQRARELRLDDDYSYSLERDQAVTPPSKTFSTILQEGPDVDVHTIAWSDNFNNLMRTLDRRSLHEFNMRVAFQMSADDSNSLIDSPAASKLGLNRAIYYNADEGKTEKFQPYSLPTHDWMSMVISKIK